MSNKSAKNASPANRARKAASDRPDESAVRGAAERADILQRIDTAEDLLGGAMIEGLRMTVMHGPTSEAEVRQHYSRCGSPSVYASNFNRGHKAAQAVGEKLALETIAKAAAATGPGSAYRKACDALKAVIDAAKKAGGQLASKAAQATVRDAVKVASTAAVDRKVKSQNAATAKRDTSGKSAATLAAASIQTGKGAREMAAFLTLAANNATRMEAPIGREAAWREACTALQDAVEKFAIFK